MELETFHSATAEPISAASAKHHKRLVSVPVHVERIVEREVPVEEVLGHEMQQRKRRLRRNDAACVLERLSQSSSLFSSQRANYSISLQCVVAGILTSSCWPIAGGRPTSLFEKWTRCRGEVPFPEEDLPAVLQVFVRTYSHAEGHWIQYTEKLLPAAINGASLPFRAHSARRFAQR